VNFSSIFPQDLYSERLIDRLAYAHDASLYRVVPKAIIRPRNENDIIDLLHSANENHIPVTFRSAGTSLSGQSIGPGIIAETVRDWKQIKILDNGKYIKLQPGVIGAHANQHLLAYNRKIGPDPASINSCMIGGIAANNSSGMVCGTQYNAYHTMKHLKFILPNGHMYDSSIKEDYYRFIENESILCEGLDKCRKTIMDNEGLSQKIRNKYKIKNTMGYSINSFLDYEHPLDIFAHLIIGSEGTLAFIANITFETIPDPPFKTTGLLLFDDMETTCSTIPFFIDQGAHSLEVLDYASLSTVKYLQNPLFDPSVLFSTQGALLCEFQGDSMDQVESHTNKVKEEFKKIRYQELCSFTTDDTSRENLWKLRKVLYPTVGSLRKTGTSVITEDICVQYSDLPAMISELQKIFLSWQFDDAVVFGHAKDGNLHYVTSLDLNSIDGERRLDGMLQDLASIIVGTFDGSLKAEHGTGRNMAPFVEFEWGGELYDIMWKIKSIADPNHILNPGVLLNKNKDTHITDLKPIPNVNEGIDLCVECGFCESVCPSRNLTMTPRQRIAITREMKLPERTPGEIAELERDFHYSGNETCATDGLCELECPVNIDTGSFIKGLRTHQHSILGEFFANFSAKHFALVQKVIRSGLRLGKFFGPNIMKTITQSLRKFGMSGIPVWNSNIPASSPKINSYSSGTGEKYIYFPSCLHRTMGNSTNDHSTVNMLMELAPRLGVQFIIPQVVNSLCCGMPFASKGFEKAHNVMIEKTFTELYSLSENGQIPILLDISTCSYHFNGLKSTQINKLHFVDIIQFFHDKKDILSKCRQNENEILVHHTCSGQKMNNEKMFEEVLHSLAGTVISPHIKGCCGTAGDRGLIFPELTTSAAGSCASNYADYSSNAVGVSSSKMCELSMSRATGIQFQSLIELVFQSLGNNNDN